MEEDFIQNGLIAYIEGDIEQSLDQFTKAINKNDKSYKAFLCRGKAYINKGDIEAALYNLNKAEELRNESNFGDDFYYVKGKALFEDENVEESKKCLEKALIEKDINEESKEKINKLLKRIE